MIYLIKIDKNVREVFWDNYIVDTERTTAEKRLHHAQKRDVVLVHDDPWEGAGCIYHNIVKEKDFYRMYYMGGSVAASKSRKVCYAESKDGLNWIKPDLSICIYNGSYANNIILDEKTDEFDNFFVFKDSNPDCAPDNLYKGVAMGVIQKEPVLWCYISADGIHFEKAWQIADGKRSFDSLNTARWDENEKMYVCYLRGAHSNETSDFVRDIRVMKSYDFKQWSAPEPISFGEARDYQMYTNVVFPYYRAEHIMVGFPTRYTERAEWTRSFDYICNGAQTRKAIMEQTEPRGGLAITDCLFMTSRDGKLWDRLDEAFFDPGVERRYNWVYGDCYPAYGMIETSGEDAYAPNEISMYVKERHRSNKPALLYRHTIRLDGFVSRHAGASEAVVVTKPFILEATKPEINFRTSAAGYIYINMLDECGKQIPGFESCEIFGNAVNRPVDFKNKLSLDSLLGSVVRMEIKMLDADIYSFVFR